MNVYFLFPCCRTSLPFDFLSVLVVRGGAVCLPTPPSWFFSNYCVIFHTTVNLPCPPLYNLMMRFKSGFLWRVARNGLVETMIASKMRLRQHWRQIVKGLAGQYFISIRVFYLVGRSSVNSLATGFSEGTATLFISGVITIVPIHVLVEIKPH